MAGFFDRLKNGLVMTRVGLGFIIENPRLFVFQLVRILLFLAVYAGLIFIVYKLVITHLDFLESLVKEKSVRNQVHLLLFILPILLIFTYLTYVVLFFTNMAIMYYLCRVLNNEHVSIRESFVIALKRFPSIIVWAGMYTGVAGLIKFIKGDEGRSSLWRKILGQGLELSWWASTFFVIPILSEEKKGIKDTIKESALLMKERFGEIVGFSVSFNILASLIFPGIVSMLFLLLSYMYDSGEKFTLDGLQYPHAWYILGIIGIITLLMRVFILSAQDLFKAAVFNYARNKATGPFSTTLIKDSVVEK